MLYLSLCALVFCGFECPLQLVQSSKLMHNARQKTKNYRVILSGLKGGIKTGAKLGGWTMAFVGLQEGLCKGIRSAQVNVQGEKGVSGAIAAGGLTLAASKICQCLCSSRNVAQLLTRSLVEPRPSKAIDTRSGSRRSGWQPRRFAKLSARAKRA